MATYFDRLLNLKYQSMFDYRLNYKTIKCASGLDCKYQVTCYFYHNDRDKRIPVCKDYYNDHCDDKSCDYEHSKNQVYLPIYLLKTLTSVLEHKTESKRSRSPDRIRSDKRRRSPSRSRSRSRSSQRSDKRRRSVSPKRDIPQLPPMQQGMTQMEVQQIINQLHSGYMINITNMQSAYNSEIQSLRQMIIERDNIINSLRSQSQQQTQPADPRLRDYPRYPQQNQ